MKRSQLRKCLHEALKKDQFGILIWPSKEMWEEHKDEITEESKDYICSVSQVKKGEEVTILFEILHNITITGAIAVPVRKRLELEEYFSRVWSFCCYYNGPITFLPSREVYEVNPKNWIENFLLKIRTKKSP